ncbi:MAG TPA: RES family NAD+ phosphorylase [Polaromonas sp.]|nr:RES family NAD+ phosphorylase [Polaromonas sp.]
MKLEKLKHESTFVLPAHAALFRTQASRARKGSIRVGNLRLPPSDLMKGRFDVQGVSVGYFAQSPQTSIYEAICRREHGMVSNVLLGKRQMLCFNTTRPLKLLDVRALTTTWPVLQSMRFELTQMLAASAKAKGFDGILYLSAQHFGQDCYALFEDSLASLKLQSRVPLLEPETGNYHFALADALRGSQITVVP